MPFISIITPVYNTEEFLVQCLDSVINQSFTDFELLLIDDGSSDRSGGICDHYSEKDSRIRVFHTDNCGVSAARNLGLDNATGEWVLFVDSDDLLPHNSLKSLVQRSSDTVDMIYGSFTKIDYEGHTFDTIYATDDYISVEKCVNIFIAPITRTKDWQRYLWNRLMRLSIIHKYSIRFYTDIFYKEDGLFLIQYLKRCSKFIASISDIVYIYRQNPNSAMGNLESTFNPRLLSIIDAHGIIYKELSVMGVNKNIKNRELAHLFNNYFWIKDRMEKTGVSNSDNLKALRTRLLSNGGFLRYVYYVILLHYWDAIKRRLLKRA